MRRSAGKEERSSWMAWQNCSQSGPLSANCVQSEGCSSAEVRHHRRASEFLTRRLSNPVGGGGPSRRCVPRTAGARHVRAPAGRGERSPPPVPRRRHQRRWDVMVSPPGKFVLYNTINELYLMPWLNQANAISPSWCPWSTFSLLRLLPRLAFGEELWFLSSSLGQLYYPTHRRRSSGGVPPG